MKEVKVVFEAGNNLQAQLEPLYADGWRVVHLAGMGTSSSVAVLERDVEEEA